MLRILLLGVGVVLIALGVAYGPVGFFTSSLSERAESVTRWEAELKTDIAKAEVFAKEVEAIGDKPASPDSHDEYAYAIASLEQKTDHIRQSGEMIDYEKSRRKEQLMITIGMVGGGLLAIAIALGLVLARKKRQSAVPIAIAQPV